MLICNEWRLIIRQKLFWLAMVLEMGFAVSLSSGLYVGQVEPLPQLFLIAMTLVMLSLPMLTAVFAVILMLRDSDHHMQELVAVTATPLRKRLWARFLALVSATAVVLLLGMLVLLWRASSQEAFAWHWLNMLMQFYIWLVLPVVLLLSALMLWLCQKTTNQSLIYVVCGGFLVGYLMLAGMTGSPVLAGSKIVNENLYQLMLWGDPYGFTAVVAQLKSKMWFNLPYLWFSRGVELLLTVVLLRLATRSHCSKERLKQPQAKPPLHSKAYSYQQATPWRALFTLGLKQLLLQRLTVVLLLLWLVFIANEELSGMAYVEAMMRVDATSIDTLNRVMFDFVPVAGVLLIALWSWQLRGLAQRQGMAELQAVCPLHNRQLIFPQVAVLWVMVLLLLVLCALISVILEWLNHSVISVRHYAVQLFYSGLPLLVIAVIFTAIMQIFRHVYLATLLVVVLLVVKFTPVTSYFNLTHTLWNIAAAPLQAPDTFWGFTASQGVYWPYMGFWLLVAAAALLMALWLSHRGTTYRTTKEAKYKWLSMMLILLTVSYGFQLHEALKAQHPLTNSTLRADWQAEYERQFKAWATKPQPSLVQVDADVAFYPQAQRAELTLQYHLLNRSDVAIAELLVGQFAQPSAAKYQLSGVVSDTYYPSLQHHVLRLKNPIQPGEQLSLQVSIAYQQPNLWPIRSHHMVTPMFSYLRSVPLLPVVGYQPEYQLHDADLRAEQGLTALPKGLPSERFKDQQTDGVYPFIQFNTTVSTELDQVAVAQGELKRHWQQQGRAFFRYETQQAIRGIPAWFSVRQKAKLHHVQGVDIALYADSSPATDTLLMAAVNDTLAWFHRHIAPYRGKRLNIIQMPDLGATGYALPQVMLLTNKATFRAFMTPTAGFDQRYRRTVHETAHQWFGHDLGSGVVGDSAFLIESMAKYVELVIIEQQQGKQAMQALVEYEYQRFWQAQRTQLQSTVALVDATENHDLYSRATLVFALLRRALGDEVIVRALQQLWSQHAYPNTPASAMDFVRALLAAAPAPQRPLIDTLLLGTDLSLLENTTEE
ncbi:M1 family aminopeptidase [Pseudoalteromonas fenneropenaei]|uniref:M1 family aminopeptidase n=1 Tax=Pseudoalteromonas fenneropenaei TaxID=1737459 RepID=A0ABV7CEV7_9GAMM